MSGQTEARRILETMANVEKMAPPGTHEHAMYVQAALFSEWPRIRALLSSPAEHPSSFSMEPGEMSQGFARRARDPWG